MNEGVIAMCSALCFSYLLFPVFWLICKLFLSILIKILVKPLKRSHWSFEPIFVNVFFVSPTGRKRKRGMENGNRIWLTLPSHHQALMKSLPCRNLEATTKFLTFLLVGEQKQGKKKLVAKDWEKGLWSGDVLSEGSVDCSGGRAIKLTRNQLQTKSRNF